MDLMDYGFLPGLGFRPKVLVVNGQPLVAEEIGRALGSECLVQIAVNSADALALATHTRFDLFLLEFELEPGKNGLQLLAELVHLDQNPDTPAIVITSHANSDLETECLVNGAGDFLTQPYSNQVLRARARTQLLLRNHEEHLREISVRDSLTGCYNRRFMDDRLDLEWARSRRNKNALAVLTMDLDCFRAYNDRYGHAAGDEALRTVARICSDLVRRPSDVFARFGGEEFVCILPDTELDQAAKLAEHMVRRVQEAQIPHERNLAGAFLTISIGLVAGRGTVLDTPRALVAAADRQRHLAKQQGRNRVVSHLLTDE